MIETRNRMAARRWQAVWIVVTHVVMGPATGILTFVLATMLLTRGGGASSPAEVSTLIVLGYLVGAFPALLVGAWAAWRTFWSLRYGAEQAILSALAAAALETGLIIAYFLPGMAAREIKAMFVILAGVSSAAALGCRWLIFGLGGVKPLSDGRSR